MMPWKNKARIITQTGAAVASHSCTLVQYAAKPNEDSSNNYNINTLQNTIMKTQNKRRRTGVFVLTLLLLVVAILSYYQLLYKSPRVDTGIVKLGSIFKGHRDIVTAVRFSPDDSLVITGSVDSTIKIWKRATGEIVRSIRQPDGITYLDMSADGNYVMTGSYDGIARIWRISDARLMKELKGHKGTVWTVAFSSDGKWVATAGDDKAIRLWSTETGELLKILQGHTLNVWALKFSPDGTKLASCSFDYSFKIWSMPDGKLITDNKEHKETVVDIAFSNDGKMLASTSDDCTIKLWNMNNGALIKTMKVPEHVQAVAFSPDDKLLMTGGRDKTLIGEFLQNIFGNSTFNEGVSARLWDVESGKLLQTFTQHSNDVMDIAYSHNGNWIATASADNTVELWHFK
jgi:WD40 repeat protein